MSSKWLNTMSVFFNIMFGCTHRNCTFPFTPKDSRKYPAASLTGTYVVCLGCGKEFPYNWKEMKIVSPDSFPSERVHKPVRSYVKKMA